MEDDDPLSAYLCEIADLPLLTPAGELELWQRIERGGDDAIAARRQVIEVHLRLVVSVARRYRDRGVRLLDLVQEGNLGLIRAVERYDHRSGVPFRTFATRWIRRSIETGLRDSGPG